MLVHCVNVMWMGFGGGADGVVQQRAHLQINVGEMLTVTHSRSDLMDDKPIGSLTFISLKPFLSFFLVTGIVLGIDNLRFQDALFFFFQLYINKKC